MTLIKSISGIRGTVGGQAGDNLTPMDVVRYTAGYAQWLIETSQRISPRVLLGRDARPSGEMVYALVAHTLTSMGVDVYDAYLSTTPTVAYGVLNKGWEGGVILTASHNPNQWNALKLLNHRGEFLSKTDAETVLRYGDEMKMSFAEVQNLGVRREYTEHINDHIRDILSLRYVDVDRVRAKKYTAVVDAVNSTGAISIPPLLEALGVDCIVINGDMNADFAHNPEPLAHHLTDLCRSVQAHDADVGIATDPDVDRLALVDEKGHYIGEEYTLVACADHVLAHHAGATVSNLSSSQALGDVARRYEQVYHASAIGEVNVVEKMKETKAVIGGEGNGGVILPDLHYGRDTLVGIALFLSRMASTGLTCSQLRATYPDYYMAKQKMNLPTETTPIQMYKRIADIYSDHLLDTTDGVKIIMNKEWIHLRASNTEPILRVYTESTSAEGAERLASDFIKKIETF